LKIAKRTGQGGLRRGFGRKKGLQDIFSSSQWKTSTKAAIDQIDVKPHLDWEAENLAQLFEEEPIGKPREIYTYPTEQTDAYHDNIAIVLDAIRKIEDEGEMGFNLASFIDGEFDGVGEYKGTVFLEFEPNKLIDELLDITWIAVKSQSSQNGQSPIFVMLGNFRTYDDTSRVNIEEFVNEYRKLM
jgi:hypothetical protein